MTAMRLWARFRRWLHCLTHFHRPVDWEIPWGSPRRIGCECGRIFG